MKAAKESTGFDAKEFAPNTQQVASGRALIAQVTGNELDSKLVQSLGEPYAFQLNMARAMYPSMTPQEQQKLALASTVAATNNQTLSDKLEDLEEGFFSSAGDTFKSILGISN